MDIYELIFLYFVIYIALRLIGMYKGAINLVTSDDVIDEKTLKNTGTLLEHITLLTLFFVPFISEVAIRALSSSDT